MNSVNALTEENCIMTESCRICLIQNINMSNIFNKTNKKIIENIQFCTGIMLKEDVNLPTRICKSCLRSLSVAHKFKTLCVLSEQTCQKVLNRVKVELPDNINEEYINDENVDNNSENNENYSIHVHDNDFDVKKEINLECYSEVITEDIEKEIINDLEVRRTSCAPKRRQRDDDNVKVDKKRGPYKKSGTPRMKKFKFTRLVCEPCGLKFTTKRESDKHKQDAHKEESYMCEVCGKTFQHRGSHYTHVRSHLPPTHACDHCDYSTANKYDLQKHLRIHLGIKKFQCAVCAAAYHTSSNLRDHERRLHRRERRFACHVCARPFYDRTKLNLHLDSHNDIKRFECEVCHTAFTRRCYWKKHLERQHSVVVPAQRPGRRKNIFVIGGASNSPRDDR